MGSSEAGAQRFSPMTAVLGGLPPDDTRYAYEIKWDGVRALSYVDPDRLRIESRNLLDITPRYPELTGLSGALDGRRAVLDGEVVAFDAQGRPDFGLLQHRMHVTGTREVRRRVVEYPVVYMVFDLLWLDGELLTSLPYTARRQALEALGLGSASWQTPGYHVGDGAAMLEASRAQSLEGVMAKRLDSPYEPGRRSRCWVKVKNVCRQEVVIGGWLEGAGNRSNRIGALLVGVYEDGRLRFSGKVGTGFTDHALGELARLLAPIEQAANPFAAKVPYKKARFVEPRLVCEVAFTEWTRDGALRHPSYKGLRADKSPEDVVREG